MPVVIEGLGTAHCCCVENCELILFVQLRHVACFPIRLFCFSCQLVELDGTLMLFAEVCSTEEKLTLVVFHSSVVSNQYDVGFLTDFVSLLAATISCVISLCDGVYIIYL